MLVLTPDLFRRVHSIDLFMMTRTGRVLPLSLLPVLLGLSVAGAQTADRLTTAVDRAFVTALVAAEDSRGSRPGALDTLKLGLASSNPTIRTVAARGLGRWERLDLVTVLLPLLDDPTPGVRAAAIDALAQSVARRRPANDSSARLIVDDVSARFAALLAREPDGGVRAMLLES